MDEENVKEQLARLERIAECPVCLEIVTPPVVQCVNGHISCDRCKLGRRDCPVCQGLFSETPARVVEQLLSAFPKRCPNQGCGAFTLLDMNSHVQFCVYRPIKCRLGVDVECGWSGTVEEWINHLTEKHETIDLCIAFNESKTFLLHNFSGGWEHRCRYLQVEGEHFLYYVSKKGDKIYRTFRHVACEKPKHEYFFEILYGRDESRVIYKSLIEALPLKDDESTENNPAVFLIDNLNSLKSEGDTLPVVIKPIKKSLKPVAQSV